MTPLFNRQIGNLSVKVSASIVALVFIINSLLCFIIIRTAYHAILDNTHTHSTESLHFCINTLDARLDKIESATASTARYSDLITSNPKSVNRLLEQLLESCSDISTAGIMFRANYYPQCGTEYAPMVSRIAGSDRLRYDNSCDLGFHYLDEDSDDNWQAGIEGRSIWSEPYFNSQSGRAMVAYSVPLCDADGTVFAVLCSEIELSTIEGVVNNSKPREECNVYIITSTGNYICDNDSSEFVQGNAMEEAKSFNNPQINEFLADVLAGNEGMKSMSVPTQYFGYYAPVRRTGWSVIFSFPTSYVFDRPFTFATRMILLGLLSLIILFALSTYFIFKMIGPYSQNLKDVTEKKASMERELSIASSLQQGLLPTHTYHGVDGVHVHGLLKPARMVGGDLYDYFIWRGRLYFTIGDVSGKGVPASLFMIEVRTLFREIASYETSPEGIINKVNQVLSYNNSSNMFCTIFAGILDLTSGHLSYCNGGHNLPILCRNSDADYLPPTGNMAVGIFDDETYSCLETDLLPGDTLFLYTDGITESCDVNRNLFGDEATLLLLKELSDSTPEELTVRVLEAIETHSAGAEQSDDITMVAIRYSGTDRDFLSLTNDVSRTPELSEWVEKTCLKHGISSNRLFNVRLAVEEAVVNVMKHAYPGMTGMPIIVTALPDDDTVCFTVEDEGVRYNPLEAAAPDSDDTSDHSPELQGMGVFLCRELMRDIRYEYVNGRNVLTLTV